MKKVVISMCLMLLMMLVVFPTNIYALQTSEQNGIKTEISFDKESYEENEVAVIL